MTSQTSIDIDLGRKEMVILGTCYAGEMKKGIFSLMHYAMPRQVRACMHYAMPRQAGRTAVCRARGVCGAHGMPQRGLPCRPAKSRIMSTATTCHMWLCTFRHRTRADALRRQQCYTCSWPDTAS